MKQTNQYSVAWLVSFQQAGLFHFLVEFLMNLIVFTTFTGYDVILWRHDVFWYFRPLVKMLAASFRFFRCTYFDPGLAASQAASSVQSTSSNTSGSEMTNSNIFMDDSPIWPCDKYMKCVKNIILLQLLFNFVKILIFSECHLQQKYSILTLQFSQKDFCQEIK